MDRSRYLSLFHTSLPAMYHLQTKGTKEYLFVHLMDATDLVYFQGQVRSKEASTVDKCTSVEVQSTI